MAVLLVCVGQRNIVLLHEDDQECTGSLTVGGSYKYASTPGMLWRFAAILVDLRLPRFVKTRLITYERVSEHARLDIRQLKIFTSLIY